MKEYYKERAPVYDRVYSYPERQADLRFLENYIPQQFNQLNMLEIAAGTGYWTQFISKTAQSILATDVTEEVLKNLKRRHLPGNVTTMVIDAYALENMPNQFDGAFAGLWLSHVPRQRLREFVIGVHRYMKPGATVLYIDNSPIQHKRLPITDMDGFGNTYQDRVLDNGTSYKVLKNFPTRQELLEMVKEVACDTEHLELENFWLFQYNVVCPTTEDIFPDT